MFNLFKKNRQNARSLHVVEWYDYRAPETVYVDMMNDRGIDNAVIHDCFFVLLSVDGVKVQEEGVRK